MPRKSTASEPAPAISAATGRNIVLCFDGTGDWACADTTNVMKIYERLDKTAQIVYYSGGVGTLGSPIALSPARRTFLKLLDLAVATSLRDHVLDAYTFLVRNHKPGDRIYLFGFSRGAFTARLLAALIHSFGLIDERNENLVPYVWQTISEFRSIGDFKRDSAKIKRDFARADQVTVRFMGLFDTVSSVGIFERFKIYPYTDKNPSVEVARHAVSIDEERNAFPELLLIPAGNDVGEVWFPGVHRDIGGGGSDHLGYPNETLAWIVEEAAKSGLLLDTSPEPPSGAEIHAPLFDPYVFVGLYPMKMFDYYLTKLDQPNRSFSLLADKVTKRPPARDSGFRWVWPNFKHIRRRPNNAFSFAGTGRVEHGGSILSWDQANHGSKPSYDPIHVNAPDLIGIVLGVALSFLIANRGIDEPFQKLGDSWPAESSRWALLLFLLFLVHQGFSQWLASRPGCKWVNGVMPFFGAFGAALLAGLTWQQEPWRMLIPAFGLGVLIAIISQAGPRPVRRADRVIPLFIVPWFMIIVGLWVVPPVLHFIKPWVLDVLGWAFNWYPDWHLQPWLDYVAWTLATVTGLSGISQIWQDRGKM